MEFEEIEDFFGTQDITDSSVVRCSDKCCSKKATCFTNIKLGLNTLLVPLCQEHANQIFHAVNKLPKLDGVQNPEAKCVLISNGSIYQWLILECPYCGQQHWHGGGKVVKDDPRQHLGYRVPHCADPFRIVADNGGQYKLVEDSPGAEPIYIINGDGCCSNCGKIVYVRKGYENALPV